MTGLFYLPAFLCAVGYRNCCFYPGFILFDGVVGTQNVPFKYTLAMKKHEWFALVWPRGQRVIELTIPYMLPNTYTLYTILAWLAVVLLPVVPARWIVVL